MAWACEGQVLPVTIPYNRSMTIGEKLLNLTAEYNLAMESRAYDMGTPSGREPSVIAAEYENSLRELLVTAPS